MTMAVTGDWEVSQTILAIGYSLLGAGLLAIMEWARFIGTIIHGILPPFLLWQAIYLNKAGLGIALQVLVAIVIFYSLSRTHIRAKFRRQPHLT